MSMMFLPKFHGRRWLNSALILSVLRGCFECRGAAPEQATPATLERTSGPSARLAVELKDRRVIVHITFLNPSKYETYFLEKEGVAPAIPSRTNLFEIECDGNEVPYIGALAKRLPATTAADYVRVVPLGSVEGSVDITDHYAFLPGKHRYTVLYRRFHGDPHHPSKLVEVCSKPATFVWGASRR